MEKLDGNFQDVMSVEKDRDECCPSIMHSTPRLATAETMASQHWSSSGFISSGMSRIFFSNCMIAAG